jgi:hypothetical protein
MPGGNVRRARKASDMSFQLDFLSSNAKMLRICLQQSVSEDGPLMSSMGHGERTALSCLSATTPNAARRPVGGDIRGSCSILSSGTSVCEQSVLLLRERQGPVRALNATFKSKMKCACRQFGMISLKNIGAIQYHSELMSCDGAVGSGIVITLGTSFRLLRQRCHQRLAVKVALADLPRQLFYRLVVVNRPLRCHRV